MSEVIPEAAVEAAAKALHFYKTGQGWDSADGLTVWECREQAASILNQAAPHMTSFTVNVHPAAGEEESIGQVALKHYR